jgi:hypothetical protein
MNDHKDWIKRAKRFGSYKDWIQAADARKFLALSHLKQKIINQLMQRYQDDKAALGTGYREPILCGGRYRKSPQWQRSYYRYVLAGIWTFETRSPPKLEKLLEMVDKCCKRR